MNHSHPATEFAIFAEEYCGLIESFETNPPEKVYTKLESVLMRLHSGVLLITLGEGADSEDDTKDLTHDQWKMIAQNINKVLGDEICQLIEWHQDSESCKSEQLNEWASRASMLWDDLAGIYQDLYNGLSHWKIGTETEQNEAQWQWRFNYESHWGNHLFQALLSAHEIRYRLCKD